MALADFAARQLAVLPAVVAGAGEHAEEDLATVDVAASALRAERHELALRRAVAAPTYDDRAAWAAFTAEFWDALALANITGVEAVAVHSRTAKNGAKNRLPGAWGVVRLAHVLIFWQHVRDRIGPVRLASLCRVLPYDLAIGGVGPLGQHPACTAGDGHPLAASVRDMDAAVLEVSRLRIVLTAEQRRAIEAYRRATGYTGRAFSGSVRGEPYGSAVKADGLGFSPVGGRGKYAWGLHKDIRGYDARWTG